MNITYIIAGLFFLLNPNINLFDIFPDFIGIALIMKGVLNISRVHPYFSAAAEKFRNLFFIELFRAVSVLVYLIITDSEKLFILVLSIGFAVFEIMWGISAWNSLFDGLVETASEGSAPYKGVDSVRKLTVAFVIAKPVLCALPDFTLLSSDSYGVVTDSGINSLAGYRMIFTVLAAIIALVLGIVWFVKLNIYFKRIKNDKVYLDHLDAYYRDNYFEDSGKVKSGNVLFALTIMFAAAIMCLELKLDGINYLPPFIGALLFALSFYLLRVYYRKISIRGICFSIVYAITSLVFWILSFRFSARYYSMDETTGFAEILQTVINSDIEAFGEFVVLCVMSAISSISFIAVLICVYKMMPPIISELTGSKAIEKNDAGLPDAIFRYEKKNTDAIRKTLVRYNTATIVIGIITAVSAALLTYIQIVFQPYWLIDAVIRIAWVYIFASFIARLRKEIKNKYFGESEF